ncbi:histidine phosphatase family protein [Sneathiella limimaris]|uniref:histidine phosphatase family protein n=1 Tax=Sneathiella limimaris TaxID=1964213 RepID=UPI00146DF81C|nr:histidine phosphatase family protein [Sneathiella limimaris]
MIPLLVIRHGKTEWNLQKKLQGRRDIPLCEEGIEELKTAIIPAEFQMFEWVSSPLQRAIQTAQILGATDLSIENRLIEMDFGAWEGHTIKELRNCFGEEMIENERQGLDMTPPEGESPRLVRERLASFLRELSSPTIAVTHKGVIRALQSLAYDWDMKQVLPIEYHWNKAHLFLITEEGHVIPERPNVRLEKP